MKLYIILLILLGLILVMCHCDVKNKENFTNFNSPCGDYPELLLKVMKERKMNDSKNFDLYIPCSYNDCENDVKSFESDKTGKKLFLIDGCDWIGSKLALWELLEEYYGKNATKYMPRTFLLEREKDIKELTNHFKANKEKRCDQMYVLKNYKQRQEGIKLTRDLDEILDGLKHGWYLVQDYVYNPYIIDNRKINFRYYMLVTCHEGKINAYIHKDGFLYYTPEYYDAHDMSFNKHITTGYIDRKVYEVNPLTLKDFRKYLESKDKGSSKVWDKSVETLMGGVMSAISKKICKNKKLDNHFKFQLFGCDVAPDNKLGCTLMEINKGPDLDAKDERDKKVKLQVQRDIFRIVDPVNEKEPNKTRFVKIF
jgi:hypothetical protein